MASTESKTVKTAVCKERLSSRNSIISLEGDVLSELYCRKEKKAVLFTTKWCTILLYFVIILSIFYFCLSQNEKNLFCHDTADVYQQESAQTADNREQDGTGAKYMREQFQKDNIEDHTGRDADQGADQ